MPRDRNGRPYPIRSNARAMQHETDGRPLEVVDSLHEHQFSRSRSAFPAPPVTDGRGFLHGGVRGAHPSQGGRETTAEEHELTDRYWPDQSVHFTQGPNGRDTFDAGSLGWPQEKPHVDTEPYMRRSYGTSHTEPLFGNDEPAAKPTDMARHWLQLNHPHLGNDYEFHYAGGEEYGHSVTVYHRGVSQQGTSHYKNHWGDTVEAKPMVGKLEWAGEHGDEDGHEPGEIKWVNVEPHTAGANGDIVDHRGKGLATAMWDYARFHVATRGITAPVHSSNRSTAGNHWAHFVGGATLPRTEGHHTQEY